MSLTPSQLTTLKTDILANTDPAVIQAVTDGANNVIADWYNQEASPAYIVYRPKVSRDEMAQAIELDDVANITDADSARLVRFFDLRPDGFYGELASERAGFDDVLSSAAGDDSQQAVAALWKRSATYGEKALANGTGAGSDADPDTMGFEGAVSANDVRDALNS